MRSTPRPSSGSRGTPRHPMTPGRSVFPSEVCVCLSGLEKRALPALADCPTVSPLPLPAPLCLPGVDGNGKSPSKAELRHLYLTEKYVWRWKQFLSRRGKRTSPLDLKLGHNNWLRQVSGRPSPGLLALRWPQVPGGVFPLLTACLLCFLFVSLASFLIGGGSRLQPPAWWVGHIRTPSAL